MRFHEPKQVLYNTAKHKWSYTELTEQGKKNCSSNKCNRRLIPGIYKELRKLKYQENKQPNLKIDFGSKQSSQGKKYK